MKFMVYAEFEINGVLHTSMEGTASWYLMSQTGVLFEHGPTPPLRECKGYKKLIPLEYIGENDVDGNEIYEGFILATPTGIAVVIRDGANFCLESPGSGAIDGMAKQEWNSSKIIGNKFENKDLLRPRG